MADYLDNVDWQPIPKPDATDGLPWATHEGVFQIGDVELRCYQLSNSQRVIDCDDLQAFLGIQEATNG